MRAQLLTLDHLLQLIDPALYLHLQEADSTNFFFFFRMLLVWYKREFEYHDVLRLWEGLWTDYLSSNFHLFVALSILEKHRTVIMEHLQHFDEILKYSMSILPSSPSRPQTDGWRQQVNDLSNTIDLSTTLIRAESLFRRFQRTVEAIDKKHSFPSASMARQRKSVSPGGEGDVSEGASSSLDAQSKGKELMRSAEESKVISAQLRQLLSRKIVVVEKETSTAHEDETRH